MKPEAAKKLFQSVEKNRTADGFQILLDGKPVRLPSGKEVLVQHESQAEAIVAEWQNVQGKINLLAMPHTRLAMAVADFSDALKADKSVHILSYAATDLLCFREPHDDVLIQRQKGAWDPWIKWIKKHFDAQFATTSGVMPHQNHPDLSKVETYLQGLSAIHLIALDHYVHVTGSMILGLAFFEKAISLPELMSAAFLEEEYQAERWGADEEAIIRRRHIQQELELMASYL